MYFFCTIEHDKGKKVDYLIDKIRLNEYNISIRQRE